MRSPGRSAPKSGATAVPARTCSRDVLGRVIPCLARTYFVNPEQSNPSRGVLPPQTYLMPRYDSAVRNTLAAAAEGGGESGIRRRAGVVRPLLVVVVVIIVEGMLAMTAERTVSGDTPRVPGEQP